MIRSAIRDQIRKLSKDTNGDSSLQRWSDTVLNDRINLVQDEMVGITGMLEYRATDTNIVSGTAEYIIPITLMNIRQALIKGDDGNYTALVKTSEKELDSFNPQWRDDTGTPTQYYESRGYIGLYPNPNFTKTAGLRIDGALKAQDLTSDSDVPFNSDYRFYFAHLGIVYGVVKLNMLDESKMTEATSFDNLYNGILTAINRQMSSENQDVRITNVYEMARATNRRSR